VRARRLIVAAAFALSAWSGAPASQAGAASTPSHPTHFARIQTACPRAKPGSARCFALLRRQVAPATAGSVGVHPFLAGDGAYATGEAGGLTPADLAAAYGYDPAGGSGQTVALVDAYKDPKIEEDLGSFDAHYGLGECTKTNGCLAIVNQKGAGTPLPANDKEGWSYEITLDVESVRAVCQGCKILLVEAESPSYKNLATAMDTAVELGATEVSNSYGGPESSLKSGEQAAYNHRGVVVTASTGDYGWDDWNEWLEGYEPPAMPNAPASLSSVVAVGGTSLALDSHAKRVEESVWNDDGVGDINGLESGYVSGGGCSLRFAAPNWQSHAAGYAAAGCAGGRLSADVAAVGDPLTGFDIYDDYNFCGCKEVEEVIKENKGWETFGGTSLSSPLIAAMYALAGGAHGLADPAITLYGRLGRGSALYDVTNGGNGYCDGEPASTCGTPNSEYLARLDCEGTSECDARSGLDGPSGVGTPIGLAAFEPVFPTAVITPPASVVANTPAAFSSAASSDPYPGGTLTAWQWNFGDGTAVSTVAAPTHKYAVAGQHTVTLEVQDGFGLDSSTAELPLTVLTEAEGRHRVEEEAAKKKREEEAVHLEEAGLLQKAEELRAEAVAEAVHKKAVEAEEEAAAHRKAEGEAAARRKAEEEAAAHRKAEEEAARHGTLPFSAVSPAAHLAGASLRVGRGGVVHIKLSCPAGVGSCIGTLVLRSVTAGPAAQSRKSFSVAVAFDVPAGKVGTVALRLPARARSLLAHAGVLRARASIAAHDPAGTKAATQSLVTMRPASPRH
jgi:PKD repeat protein